MIASLQIYNVRHNIDRQTLHRLHEFTQFANNALGGNRHDHKHFQTLAFLVRDSDGDSGFGIGTAEFWRAIKEGAMHQVGEDLALSFERIDGFLMTHPGKPIHTGLKGRLHTYKNVFEAMDDDFKQSVKDFTQTMLSPDRLRTKQVNGETVTCESAVNYIKKWTSSFRDCRMPPPTTFFDATAEVHNQLAVESAIKAYAGYTQEGEHAAFKKINANLAVPVSRDTYDALWDDFIAQGKQSCAHYHLNRTAFADKHQEHRSVAYAKFYKFAARGDDSALDAVSKLEHELKRKVANGRNCYKRSMTTAQNNDEPWITSRLQSCHEKAADEAIDVAGLNRCLWDGDFALAREHLARQIKVAKASFIPPDMPGDKNVHAWDHAIAHYIKRMDRICKLYVSSYIEPDAFKKDTSSFTDEAKKLFKDRCANDSRSEDFKETLLHEIARHREEYEKINNKNWWWQAYKKVATFFSAPFGVFKRRLRSPRQLSTAGLARRP
ncbi:atlastin-2 [Aphelenchoides avenae]|nr:atlastin-2 [Aphelenchus avenae]